MSGKENELAVVNQSLAAFSESPITQIDIAKKINTKVYEIFEVDKLLTELNTRIFNGKGTITPAYQSASISPDVGGKDEPRETPQSRFSKLFTLNYESIQTSLGSELYIKKEDIPTIKNGNRLKGVGIKAYQEIDIPNEILKMYILGKLYFKAKRAINGRWGDPFIVEMQGQGKEISFLQMQSQGKSLGFSLRSVPPADEVRFAFLENTLQILDDLSVGNFIPSIRDEEGNIKF